jgi:hypothetical protein
MFLIMGSVHIIAAAVLVIAGVLTNQPSDDVVIWSQFIGGLVELVIGSVIFFNNDCKFEV